MLTLQEIQQSRPLNAAARATVSKARSSIQQILDRRDPRLLVVVGPCSMHDPLAASDYAARLRELARELSDSLFIVMRTYLEKPRSTVGWKGFVTDPGMDDSCQIEEGLDRARALLNDINALGLPCATESLDPMLVPYTQDLVSWTALGARTAESQVHRTMASGLPMPVGIKNGTDGCVGTAVDGIEAIANPHTYMAVAEHGRVALTRSSGNAHTHVVLRGGRHGPNFDASGVAQCEAAMVARGMRPSIMIDCSHANANKMHERQLDVLHEVTHQLCAGNQSLIGVMLESFLFSGNQPATQPASERAYGVSVTDPCLGWVETQRALRELRESFKPALALRASAPQRAVA